VSLSFLNTIKLAENIVILYSANLTVLVTSKLSCPLWKNGKKSDFLAGARRRKGFPDKSLRKQGKHFSGPTIKAAVFKLLDKNPLLTAQPICKILELRFNDYRMYVSKLRSQWRSLPKNERGSKCSIHGWRGWCYLPKFGKLGNPKIVSQCDKTYHDGIRFRAVRVGWVETKARNRWLLWKERVGRLQWFETGRVNLFVRKPANLGKAYQLICNGFSFTGLVTDIKVLEQILLTVRFKGAHYVFPTEQRLPRLTIDLFGKSNGVIIKVGDRSHPHAVEVIACYPDWAERNERLLEHLNDTLKRLFTPVAPNNLKRDVDYVA